MESWTRTSILDEAFDLLDEWPLEKLDIAYEALVRACREGASGRRPVYAAREDFVRLLKRNGKLASIDDMPPYLRDRTDRNISGV